MSVTEKVEHVLVVPTLLFHELGHFQGFCTDVGPYLKTLLDPAYISFRPRDKMEADPSFKQLIPYCIFRCDGKLFHYERGKTQGEGRLHNKRSIGVGGHISSEDQNLFTPVYIEAMHREIEEEVYLEAGYKDTLVGLLNDDETEVGRVHLGIVHIFDLDAPKVRPREKSMLHSGFASPEELIQDINRFETWSQLCLRHLFGREASTEPR
ncbi:MAG: phosphoesterase [Planctomycetaceae bacterium]|nr:phosphoesterase [Planctomycetaceae bacterium]